MAAKKSRGSAPFVHSVAGITHNPKEYSTRQQVARGAQVLLDAVLELAA